MVRNFLFLLLFMAWCQFTHAHPPSTIVVNAMGQAFYSDLQNVWMVDNDGSVNLVVRNVHTHHLWLDHEGYLNGEDVQNHGEQYRHRVWKIDRDGRLTNVIEWTAGHPTDVGGIATIRNHQGVSVILNRRERAIEIGRETSTPRVVSLAALDGPIHELTIGPSGTIFVAVGRSIYVVNGEHDQAEHFVTLDIAPTSAFAFVHERHALMGMHARDGDVYVAVFSGQVVVKVDTVGAIQEAALSSGDWSPVGITTDTYGHLWVLEASTSNEMRVSRTDASGSRVVFHTHGGTG